MENEITNSTTSQKKSSKKSLILWVAIGIAEILLLVTVFGFGVFAGAQRARFSYRWAENYHRLFGGPPLFGGRDFIDGHGVFGQILKIENNTLTVKDRGEIEKSIVVSDQTTIKRGPETIKASDLKVDDKIVVIGSPTKTGQIKAKMIRVFPF